MPIHKKLDIDFIDPVRMCAFNSYLTLAVDKSNTNIRVTTITATSLAIKCDTSSLTLEFPELTDNDPLIAAPNHSQEQTCLESPSTRASELSQI